MGKRSDFKRLERDNYATPAAAVAPLLPWLPQGGRYLEPCAGAGRLIEHLTSAGHILVSGHDLPTDARSARYDIPPGAIIVTNAPWSRPVLHEIFVNLSDQAPTWLLIDADWVHTQQAIPYLSRLRMIVSSAACAGSPARSMTARTTHAGICSSGRAPGRRFIGRQTLDGAVIGRPHGHSHEAPALLDLSDAVALLCCRGG
jgi:hypothetical protein